MMKVALCPCSVTNFPSVVRMCSPRGAFPGHFSILAMYFSRKPSVQLLDTILRYLGNSNKRRLGSGSGWKSFFVLFLHINACIFSKANCLHDSLTERKNQRNLMLYQIGESQTNHNPTFSRDSQQHHWEQTHIVEVNYSALLKGRELLQLLMPAGLHPASQLFNYAFYYIFSASGLLEGTWNKLPRALSSPILKWFKEWVFLLALLGRG